jgi:hypothetical protein
MSLFLRPRMVWSLAGAVAVAATVWASTRSPAERSERQAQAPPVPVAVATASRADVPVRLSALGSVAAFNTVTVKSRVDGQLMQVMFREGQLVRRASRCRSRSTLARHFNESVPRRSGQLPSGRRAADGAPDESTGGGVGCGTTIRYGRAARTRARWRVGRTRPKSQIPNAPLTEFNQLIRTVSGASKKIQSHELIALEPLS